MFILQLLSCLVFWESSPSVNSSLLAWGEESIHGKTQVCVVDAAEMH